MEEATDNLTDLWGLSNGVSTARCNRQF